jgi:hypothetical protein
MINVSILMLLLKGANWCEIFNFALIFFPRMSLEKSKMLTLIKVSRRKTVLLKTVE